MSFNQVAQRIALLSEVIYNVNSGKELREDQVVNVKGISITLPRDFYSIDLYEKTKWIKDAMNQFLIDNSDCLLNQDYFLRGEINFGSLHLKVSTEKKTIKEQQDEC